MIMNSEKFEDSLVTAAGDERAYVPFGSFDTLWFNTGSRCNLSCGHCYLQSSPTNDRLRFLDHEDVAKFLFEISEHSLPVKTIGLTGGEPFYNPYIMEIIQEVLVNSRADVLILTNGLQVLSKHREILQPLNEQYPGRLHFRVSLDHYSKELHEKERGNSTFDKALGAIRWFVENEFFTSIAARNLASENQQTIEDEFQRLMDDNQIDLQINTNDTLTIFPEMSMEVDVPEITTKCWGILHKSPEDVMCANSRMVEKTNSNRLIVQSCTLLPYESQFEMGESLIESMKEIRLNHPYCSQFCVLGGSSCC